MDSMPEKLSVIILAAGLGKRMKSGKAKVLHELLGKPMIQYVVDTASRVAGTNVYVIVGFQSEQVKAAVEKNFNVHFVLQERQLGTGHAVSCALPYIENDIERVIIICGDTPLISYETLVSLYHSHLAEKNDITVLAVELKNPKGYGRILFNEKRQVIRIVEEADANDDERKIMIVNSGIYCVEKQFLMDAVQCISIDNKQKEMYLTDIVSIGYEKNKSIGAVLCNNSYETLGVNCSDDLLKAEKVMESRVTKKT